MDLVSLLPNFDETQDDMVHQSKMIWYIKTVRNSPSSSATAFSLANTYADVFQKIEQSL